MSKKNKNTSVVDSNMNGKKGEGKLQELEKEYLHNRCQLGESQKKEIEELQNKYFVRTSNFGEEVLQIPDKKLASYAMEIYKSYLKCLTTSYSPQYPLKEEFDEANRIAYVDITRWVIDKNEDCIEKLATAYQVLANEECNVSVIYHQSMSAGCQVLLAVENTKISDSKPLVVIQQMDRLTSAILGNFPGTGIKYADDAKKSPNMGVPKCLRELCEKIGYESDPEKKTVKVTKSPTVSVVTNLVSEKTAKYECQGIEKLFDGFLPKTENDEFTIVLLASPVRDKSYLREKFCAYYNELTPYATWQENFSANENTSIMEGASLGKSVNVTGTVSVTAGFEAGAMFAKASGSVTGSLAVGGGVSFGKMANHNVTVGETSGYTKTCTNYAVKNALEKLEKQVKRLDESDALGMWNFAAYIISESPIVSSNVANMYLALTQGNDSYLSESAINTWLGKSQAEGAATIIESVSRLNHPAYVLNAVQDEEDYLLLLPTTPAVTTPLSGRELAKAFDFPQKSVSGLPVIECVAFGREIHKYDKSIVGTQGEIEVGNIYHMQHDDIAKVKLDVKSLASHVFVTGSTGSGKSNTIYQLINSIKGINTCSENDSYDTDDRVKFMIIEPAKGEYKDVFGGECHVLSTNPEVSDLLRVNPFAFPQGVHVLEHIERLVEIMNACWPMYAAMPAVLKDAIERAYEDKGWDLQKNKCLGEISYPNFQDVQLMLREVMKDSAFSDETKGNYEGALVTRVRSLTNGINGLIFCSDKPIDDKALFDENVIVDLSRVGSPETKALIMGFIVMKLQEYRRANHKGNNSCLRHITVLEEAHNLLRKTSVSDSEGSNMQGKSVEMITNAIAEMRTYGEGFIIVDQAPGLLDEAVIRNTNTKIILRLPEEEDRRLVGKSANLKDEQIDEIAKLPVGVACVYQNNWVEAVLCDFKEFTDSNPYKIEDKGSFEESHRDVEELFKCVFMDKAFEKKDKEQIDRVDHWIMSSCYELQTRIALRKVLQGRSLTDEDRHRIAYDVFNGRSIARRMRDGIDCEQVIHEVDSRIKQAYEIENNLLVRIIRENLIDSIEECAANPEWLQVYRELSNTEVVF